MFAYDRVSRLKEANLQPDSMAQSYTFDSFGNLNSITSTDSTDPLNPVTTPRPIGVSTVTNRLTGASYDGSGNVTSLFTLSSFTYDAFNRVTHLVGTGVNKSFLYDTSDNRVAILDQQAHTEEWQLRGLHDKVVRSFLSSPEGWSWKQDWVYRDGQLVGSTSPARWREYHLDHLGSPRLVTGPIGLKVAEYHPFPFGEMASQNGPGVDGMEGLFRYTGHERDVKNCEDGSCAPKGQDDLDYMLARFYSPVMGRFLGVDPADSYRATSPQRWNRFSYAWGNPAKFVDPDGEESAAVHQDLDMRSFAEGDLTLEDLRERRVARAVPAVALGALVLGAVFVDLIFAPDANLPSPEGPDTTPATQPCLGPCGEDDFGNPKGPRPEKKDFTDPLASSDQFEEVEDMQRKSRQAKAEGFLIEDTQKSKQREKNEFNRIRSLEDLREDDVEGSGDLD